MIQEYIETIRTAVPAKDVRKAIADGLEQAYDDAIESGNSGIEVMQAHGEYADLPARLDARDAQLSQIQTDAAAIETALEPLDGCIIVSDTVPETLQPGQICIIGRTS